MKQEPTQYAPAGAYFFPIRLRRCLAVSAVLHVVLISLIGAGSFARSPLPDATTRINATLAGATQMQEELPLAPVLEEDEQSEPAVTPTEEKPEAPVESEPTPRTENPGLAEQFYFPKDSLSRPPELVQNVNADPLLQDITAISLGVTIELFVNERGEIDDVIVNARRADEAAIGHLREIFSGLRFRPGELNGRPVKSRIRIELYVSENGFGGISANRLPRH